MTTPFVLDHRCKSYPLTAAPCPADAIARKGWNLLADDLAYPLAVLRHSALAHNIAWMQAYAARKGVALAPHGKTSLSPELFTLQLAAGAWGLTFATVGQLAVGVEAGARRAIIANRVLCDADLDGLHSLLQRHPGLRLVASCDRFNAGDEAAFFDDQFVVGRAGKRKRHRARIPQGPCVLTRCSDA